MEHRKIILNGHNIHDIPSFYREVTRVFMKGEDWQLGQSLDALNDMLYVGYGAISKHESLQLIWENFEQNRLDLGMQATRNFYTEKLKHPGVFSIETITKQLNALNNGTGQTFFDIVLEIIASHPNFKIIPR